MSAGTRGIARHTIIYGLGTVLQKGVAFVMLPVYTRILTLEDYGVVALIDMTLDVISIGAGAQLAYAIYRFYHKAETEADRRTVVSTVFFSLLVSYALTAGLTFAFADRLSVLLFDGPERATLIRVAAGSMFSQCLLIVPFAYLQVQEKSAASTTISLVKLVMQLSLNILLLVWLRVGVIGILLSTLIANAITGILLSAWTIRRVGISFSSQTLRSLFRYAGPMIVTQFATFFATFGDRYFLKAYGTEADVGLFNLSYQFAFLMYSIGFIPFDSFWGPRRFAIAKEQDVTVRDRGLSDGFNYANVLILSTTVGIALLVGDVLRVMTTPPFFPAADAVPFILGAYVLLAWASIQDVGILVRERTEFVTLSNWIALAVSLAAWVLLIPRFGSMGAAWACSISFLVKYVCTYTFSQRLWPVRYEWGPTLRMAGVGITLVVGASQLPQFPIVPSIAVHAVLASGYLAFVWHAGALSPDLRRELISKARVMLSRTSGAAAP
jgi:O-antigen/teichoic acid export membrane protein